VATIHLKKACIAEEAVAKAKHEEYLSETRSIMGSAEWP